MLKKIQSPQDLKKLKPQKLKQLAKEIRIFLLNNISQTGGHLASNLGVVELTLALHRFLDCPKDKLIWDVGHQSYVHKIITGRREKFSTLRQIGGLSGFPRPEESIYDAFATGHSSTSISAAIGMAEAFKKQKTIQRVVAVIGDGSLTSGLALEAINQIGYLGSQVIIVLNDNRMSISQNVGALAQYTKRIEKTQIYQRVKNDLNYLLGSCIEERSYRRLKSLKKAIKRVGTPGLFFEKLGINYLGPVDGHIVTEISQALKKADKLKGPVLIHARTQKGHGYKPAEKSADQYHGVSAFDVTNGCSLPKNKKPATENYTQALSDKLLKLAKKNPKIIGITAAMATGTGLGYLANQRPKQFYDVGICESHAVTFAAGLAKAGLRPVVAIYSTFLQRAYDQILHDVCLQKLPVVLTIDRAGLVGEDGPTHHGVFDLSYLLPIPNLTVLAPRSPADLGRMLELAITEINGPVAIRYPKEALRLNPKNCPEIFKKTPKNPLVKKFKLELIHQGNQQLYIAVGNQLPRVLALIERLRKKRILKSLPTIINPRFLKPLDPEIFQYAKKAKKITVVEENSKIGGFGSFFLNQLTERGLNKKVEIQAIEDKFIEHGEVFKLRQKYIK
ncbi:MAG: 1-deoxy-D-xylulose-5-phosphate synthase [Candidatus Moranbacteria bacterium]|nr:1-deoxy-D-xylulose-5-phosphate synthase [Candidatus Moranbacteria bacterium]